MEHFNPEGKQPFNPDTFADESDPVIPSELGTLGGEKRPPQVETNRTDDQE